MSVHVLLRNGGRRPQPLQPSSVIGLVADEVVSPDMVEEGRGVTPDVEVVPTLAQRRAGVDVILAAAERLAGG